ncbi:MAG: polyhydroxyalkanoate depolymerase, partial [Sphingorhabdus sp.]
MLYTAHEIQKKWLAGASYIAQIQADWLNSPANPFSYLGVGSVVASALDVFSHAAMTRGKPAFGLDTTLINGK